MVMRGVATVVLAVALALSSCTAEAERKQPRQEKALDGCGPVAFRDLSGRTPRNVGGPLARFPNDHALCAGRWLPDTGTELVPQGLAIDGRTAWVSGYDGGGSLGTKYCRVVRIDLRTSRVVTQQGRIGGQVGSREPVECRHGGGLVRDEHGLWLSEKTRLWLLDPETLQVQRAWAVLAPLEGSFLLRDDDGRLGVGAFDSRRRTVLAWFDPADLLSPGLLDIVAADALAQQPAPANGQGAFWADLGRGGPRVWFIRSSTRCGQLVGGRRLGFLPGAEGAAYSKGRLWVLSESTSESYVRAGGRPVVPHLSRFDLSGVGDWQRVSCEP